MACSKECHHGLQLPGGGAIDRAVHRRCSTARIAMGQEAGRRSGGSGTPYSAAGYGADSAAAYGAGWANRASQQNEDAQLARTWWRRIAVSEVTWKSASASSKRCLAGAGACRRGAVHPHLTAASAVSPTQVGCLHEHLVLSGQRRPPRLA
jgi:hypothetical protein